jgi:glycosyltransferase involved in cell wall biosynthesis/SAM-dependent methyltransferase
VSTQYLYIGSDLRRTALVSTGELTGATGRREIALDPGSLTPTADAIGELDRYQGASGVVIAATSGVIDRARLRIARAALRRGLPVWLHWPHERAVESIDADRIQALARLRVAVIAMERLARPVVHLVDASTRLKSGLAWVRGGTVPIPSRDVQQIMAQLEQWSRTARPIVPGAGNSRAPLSAGPGLYLRTDFWNQIISGGSYGHSCYVAKELSATAPGFACLLPHRYELLDQLGVFQVALDVPPGPSGEDAMIAASPHYLPMVRTACRLLEPAYIYERLCLGDWVGALISRELRIPYLLEYNGSEIVMHRGSDKPPLEYANVYEKVEEFAFRQAAVISVVSAHIKDDLVRRGIDARKILVNPNGADLERYAPPSADEKRRVRATLGFADDECVIGFTGTFGWWHGVDVLAAAIPRLCRSAPHVRFLLIGDGTHKPLLDDEIERHGLADRVIRVGSVPQTEGARLLKACDVFVSPHSRHMFDGKFFGSPTKIFEYMAMAGGIVATDLEQIGEVLSPALRPADLTRGDISVRDERAVLCTPGDVDGFVDGVAGLIRRRDIADALGRNARQAVAEYSWRRHVERLWAFVDHLPKDDIADSSSGSRAAQPHTLEWFLEVERERYHGDAPWLPDLLDGDSRAGQQVLEIGCGIGTDLAQFAGHGAEVTGAESLETAMAGAQENFRLRGLPARFVRWDGETLPLESGTFDFVYATGVGDTPPVARVVSEMFRLLKTGGAAMLIVPAERSLHYWCDSVWKHGVSTGDLSRHSMAAIVSQSMNGSGGESKGTADVYTRARIRELFRLFEAVRLRQLHLSPNLLPRPLRRFSRRIERVAGSTLIVQARKPYVRNRR